jgi:hypothetical protein
MLCFESLCSLFRPEDSTGDASKLSLALAEWPDRPSSSDVIKIGRGFDASLGTAKKSKKQQNWSSGSPNSANPKLPKRSTASTAGFPPPIFFFLAERSVGGIDFFLRAERSFCGIDFFALAERQKKYCLVAKIPAHSVRSSQGLNFGPPAPEAGIIPLDQPATVMRS